MIRQAQASGGEAMILVLLKTQIDSPEHLEELIRLAKEQGVDYGHKKSSFFVQLEIDERCGQRTINKEPQNGTSGTD